MSAAPIHFNDGAAYERMMGVWSRIAGEVFLDWVAPPPGLRWIDIGCGSGAFSELIARRCRPAAIQGIDPSQGQLTFARTRPGAAMATFQQGDALALPFQDQSFDAAVMALVIFFLPDPAKGVAEMVRVLASGGLAAAYAWDATGGGTPHAPIGAELRAMGLPAALPPSADASRLDVMRQLWAAAGLVDVATLVITAERAFADFDDFWSTTTSGTSIAATIAAMSPADLQTLKARVRTRLRIEADGRVMCTARANAVKGRKPA